MTPATSDSYQLVTGNRSDDFICINNLKLIMYKQYFSLLLLILNVPRGVLVPQFGNPCST